MAQGKPLVMIKIGGQAAEPVILKLLAREMEPLKDAYQFLLVHGGGAEVSQISKLFGLNPRFIDGIRMTTAEEMEVVDMVLAGKINKGITRIFRAAGLNALGLSGNDGGLFTGEALEEDSHTGRVNRVNKNTLEALLAANFLPVVSSPSMDINGRPLNINADEAALALASSYPAELLLFISEVPGVLRSLPRGKVLPRMNKAEAVKAIDRGMITGGMIPKITSALEALRRGVGNVIIGQYTAAGDLHSLLKGKKGTKIGL